MTDARQVMTLARETLRGGYDLVVLGEITGAVDFGLVGVEEILELIGSKPERTELVLTGRNAHHQAREAANLMEEICGEKHYFRERVDAREGLIER